MDTAYKGGCIPAPNEKQRDARENATRVVRKGSK